MKNLLLIFVVLFSGLIFNGCFEKDEKEIPKHMQLLNEAKKKYEGKLKTSSDWDTEYWVRDNKTKKDKK